MQPKSALRMLARRSPMVGAWLVAALAFGHPSPASAAGGGQVQQICSRIVGLAPGEKHFAACEESLSASLRNLRQGEGISLSRRTCLDEGHRPRTPDFARCELDAAPAAEAPLSDGGPVPGGSRSYFVVSRSDAFRRDQMACAQLGIDPAGDAFAECTAGLRAALARASQPAM